MDDILLIGSGGHARACIDVIEQEGRFRIGGLVEKKDTEMKNDLWAPIGAGAGTPSSDTAPRGMRRGRARPGRAFPLVLGRLNPRRRAPPR